MILFKKDQTYFTTYFTQADDLGYSCSLKHHPTYGWQLQIGCAYYNLFLVRDWDGIDTAQNRF